MFCRVIRNSFLLICLASLYPSVSLAEPYVPYDNGNEFPSEPIQMQSKNPVYYARSHARSASSDAKPSLFGTTGFSENLKRPKASHLYLGYGGKNTTTHQNNFLLGFQRYMFAFEFDMPLSISAGLGGDYVLSKNVFGGPDDLTEAEKNREPTDHSIIPNFFGQVDLKLFNEVTAFMGLKLGLSAHKRNTGEENISYKWRFSSSNTFYLGAKYKSLSLFYFSLNDGSEMFRSSSSSDSSTRNTPIRPTISGFGVGANFL